MSTVTALPLWVRRSGLAGAGFGRRAVGDQPVGGGAAGADRGREGDQQPLDGGRGVVLPAFQRAVTSNSAGTGVPGGSTTARPRVPRTLRLRGERHARADDLAAAGDAGGLTDVEEELGRDGTVAADAAASKGPAKPAIRIARTRRKRTARALRQTSTAPCETVHHTAHHTRVE